MCYTMLYYFPRTRYDNDSIGDSEKFKNFHLAVYDHPSSIDFASTLPILDIILSTKFLWHVHLYFFSNIFDTTLGAKFDKKFIGDGWKIHKLVDTSSGFDENASPTEKHIIFWN